jgi:hypothetical protein
VPKDEVRALSCAAHMPGLQLLRSHPALGHCWTPTFLAPFSGDVSLYEKLKFWSFFPKLQRLKLVGKVLMETA